MRNRKVIWLVVGGMILLAGVTYLRVGEAVEAEEEVIIKRGVERGLKVVEKDRDNDGKPDHWTYYKGNEIVKIEADGNSDGKVDMRIEFRRGRPVKRLMDRDFDGKWDMWVELGRDKRPSKRKVDLDFDGKIDRIIEKGKR